MPFPLILQDFTNNTDLMRINPDASITVLNWSRVCNWAADTPNDDTGFLIGMCRVLQGARYNFVETSLADSDTMGQAYRGVTIVNGKGEHPGQGGIYGMTDDFMWQVNWKVLERIYRKVSVTPMNAATVGFLNLFFAGRDNFVAQSIQDDEVV